MASERLPRAQGALTDAAGHPLPEWYDYWRMIGEALDVAESDAERIAILEAAVAALQQAGESVSITGTESVRVLGSSADGYVLTLDGDDPGPGASHYYGTDADRVRGFFARLLATLADVDVTGLANGNLLRWIEADGTWQPIALSDFIVTLLDDVDAAAARATLEIVAANVPADDTDWNVIVGDDVQAALDSVDAELDALWSVADGITGPVPTLIASGATYTVPAETQVLWTDDIDIEGELEVLGNFSEVD